MEMNQHCSSALEDPGRVTGSQIKQAAQHDKKRELLSIFDHVCKTGRNTAPLPQHHGASCKASQLLSAQAPLIKAGRELGRRAASG